MNWTIRMLVSCPQGCGQGTILYYITIYYIIPYYIILYHIILYCIICTAVCRNMCTRNHSFLKRGEQLTNKKFHDSNSYILVSMFNNLFHAKWIDSQCFFQLLIQVRYIISLWNTGIFWVKIGKIFSRMIVCVLSRYFMI